MLYRCRWSIHTIILAISHPTAFSHALHLVQQGGTAGSAGRTRSQRTMRLVNKNEVRNLTVRDPKQRPGTLTLSFSEYSRIRQNSVPFAESHEAMRTSQRQQSRAKAMSESMARKAEFEALDRELASNEGPDDLEQDQIAREEEILLHARAAMEDSEEEVRKLKTKILGAKCMAVRDKQVEEYGNFDIILDHL